MSYNQPTDTVSVSYPLSIDASIQALQQELADNLVWLEYSFGRAFNGKDEQQAGANQFYPAVYKGDSNYQDASPNDNIKSQSFFVIDGSYDYGNYDINEQNLLTVPVSLIVWGNLKRIAPSTDEHFGQLLLQDTLKVIRDNGDFKVTSIIDNDEDVYREYSISKEHTPLFYYPYFCYRIKMSLSTKEDCYEQILQGLIDYNIVEAPPTPTIYGNSLDASLDFTL
jgi:hypothetical protein